MNKKRILAMTLLVVLVLISGCKTSPAQTSPVTSETPTANVISVVDFLDREVKLDKIPEKIVSLTASNTEILYALGLGDKVVGVDEYSDYPAEAASKPKVGDFNGPNIEQIVALQPDLVLAGNKLQKSQVESLENVELNVIAAEASSYDEIYESIQMIGKICGVSDKATELVDEMKAKEAQVKEQVAGKETPTVYYVISYGEYGNWTSGPGTFVNDIMTMAGGDCITKDHYILWIDYNMEDLIEKDPDYLLCASDSVQLDDIKQAAGYKDLTAVKENRIFTVDAAMCSRPGPRIVDAMKAIADILHG